MKLTLLELTQDILSRLDSDEVNSITSTTESMQVARVIRNAYFNIIARANLPEHKKVFALDASNDTDLPTVMTKPVDINRIEWIKYNCEVADEIDEFKNIYIIPFEQFVDMLHSYNLTDTNVGTYTLDDKTFHYKDDQAPSFCTIYKDNYILFDSYDVEVDDTLQSVKTMVYGEIMPSFSLTDSFTPDLDDQQFPLLINEATSLAFYELKQAEHSKAEQEARRQWRTLQRTKATHNLSYLDELPHFGRK